MYIRTCVYMYMYIHVYIPKYVDICTAYYIYTYNTFTVFWSCIIVVSIGAFAIIWSIGVDACCIGIIAESRVLLTLIDICSGLCVHVYIRTCIKQTVTCVHTYMCIHVYVRTCIYQRTLICMYSLLHTYIYIYVYLHSILKLHYSSIHSGIGKNMIHWCCSMLCMDLHCRVQGPAHTHWYL